MALDLRKNNKLEDIYNQINSVNTEIPTADLENFNRTVTSKIDPLKQKIDNLSSGVQQQDIQKFNDIRTATNPQQATYEQKFNAGLDKMEQFTNEQSDVYKNIFGRALDRFDATSATANMNQAVKIAANPMLSDAAKRAGTAELSRATESNRAQLAGDVSEKITNMVMGATQNFTNMSLAGANYEEGKFMNSAGLAVQEMSNNIELLRQEGALTQSELDFAYRQVTDTISTKMASERLKMEKAAALGNAEINNKTIEKMTMDQYTFWGNEGGRVIDELKPLNGGTITADQALKDPRVVSFYGERYKMLGGDPTDIDAFTDYIQAEIDSRPSAVENDQIAIENYKNSLKRSYPEMSQEQIDQLGMLWMDAKNQISRNDDGSIDFKGADGSIIGRIDKDGNVVDGETIQEQENPTNKPGTVSVDKSGNVVKTDGNGVDIPVTVNDVWGSDADKLIEDYPDSETVKNTNEERIQSIVDGNYDGFKYLKPEDPAYKEALRRLDTDVSKDGYSIKSTLTGRKNIINRPSLNEWIIAEVDGKKVPLQVTYTGRVDRSMSGDYDYIEFKSPDGTKYNVTSWGGGKGKITKSDKRPKNIVNGYTKQ